MGLRPQVGEHKKLKLYLYVEARTRDVDIATTVAGATIADTDATVVLHLCFCKSFGTIALAVIDQAQNA